jgi:hypothetical protein
MQRLAISAILTGSLAVSSALAFTGNTAPAGAHYRQGYSEPFCALDGLGVSCTETAIAGVGNTDADAVLSIAYSATVQCRNRGGKIVEVKTQSVATVGGDDITELRNGTLYVSAISVGGPSNESFLGSAVCPNGNWTKLLLGSPSITSYVYSLTFHGYDQPAILIEGP